MTLIDPSVAPPRAASPEPAWDAQAFEAQLRSRGDRYHIHHPFNRMLNQGRASVDQVRGWVANRFYYQVAIPVKDAAILSNCPDRAVRRGWIQRILDHDGHGDDPGGIEAWLRLGMATGLSREEITDLRHVLPGVRFAVDAYLNFARRAPWQEAVCSSLTELFAPEIHKERLAGALPVDRAWRPALLPQPRQPGPSRRGAGPGHNAGALRHPRPAAARAGHPAIQAGHPVGHERRHGGALRGHAMSAAGSPRIAPGMRLQWEPAQQSHVLLYPEGMVRLNRSAGEILSRCDGHTAPAAIVASLEQAFDMQGLGPQVEDFLAIARRQGWVVDA